MPATCSPVSNRKPVVPGAGEKAARHGAGGGRLEGSRPAGKGLLGPGIQFRRVRELAERARLRVVSQLSVPGDDSVDARGAGPNRRQEVSRRTRSPHPWPDDDRPPWSGPGAMLVQRRSWDQSERGRRSWPGSRSRPRGVSRHEDLSCGRAVAEGRVRPNGIVVATPALDQDLCLAE